MNIVVTISKSELTARPQIIQQINDVSKAALETVDAYQYFSTTANVMPLLYLLKDNQISFKIQPG